MAYDLVIRNGTVIDGSGGAGYRADVAISGDRIAEIGKVTEAAKREIDAEGHAVTPGFVDGHTHMDAQVFWDQYGTSSCWHGVTSVVMGNCGFTLAPSRRGEENLVVTNLERAEDIPGTALAAGIDWSWESFPQYLDAVEAAPKSINYACQIGHSALRTYVMGERAFSEEANEDDLVLMENVLKEAMSAGAFGFSSSNGRVHQTMDGRPVASRVASTDEVTRLVQVVGELGFGLFQLAPRSTKDEPDLEVAKQVWLELKDLSVETKVPITYGMQSQFLQFQLDNFDQSVAEGGDLWGMSRSGSTSLIFSFKSGMPFDRLPVWEDFRKLPCEQQLAGLRDEPIRQRLMKAVDEAYASGGVSALASTRRQEKLPSFDILEVIRDNVPNVSVAELARQRGTAPIALMLDLSVETNFEQVFGRYSGWKEPELLKCMKHPRTVMTFSDSGAHVSYHSGAELQTTLLVEWVRDRQAFTLEEAVKMMTSSVAKAWHLPDRGLLKEGMIADINVFDPQNIGLKAPTIAQDLPGGAQRVIQKASGFRSTIVSGQETLANGEHTGALSGKLMRGSLARA